MLLVCDLSPVAVVLAVEVTIAQKKSSFGHSPKRGRKMGIRGRCFPGSYAQTSQIIQLLYCAAGFLHQKFITQ